MHADSYISNLYRSTVTHIQKHTDIKPKYKNHMCVGTQAGGTNTGRQHHRCTDLNWTSARIGVRQPGRTRSEHHSPIPDSQGRGLCVLVERKEPKDQDSSRLLNPSPLFAPASDAIPPLLFPSAPSSSPHRLLPARSSPPRSRLSPSVVTQGPLLPFSLSSPPPRLPCRLSLGKGGGELANAGRSQVEATREGKKEGFPTSTSRCWTGGSASRCSSFPTPPSSSQGRSARASAVPSLHRRLSGPHLSVWCHQLLYTVGIKNHLVASYVVGRKNFFLARMTETPCIQTSSTTKLRINLPPLALCIVTL